MRIAPVTASCAKQYYKAETLERTRAEQAVEAHREAAIQQTQATQGMTLDATQITTANPAIMRVLHDPAAWSPSVTPRDQSDV